MKLRAVAILTSLVLAIFAGTAGGQRPPANIFVAHLTGGEEVPEVATTATGQAVFTFSSDRNQLHYKLIVANIENVVASHIHMGAAGINGPVVAFLAGPLAPAGGPFNGVLAEGTIEADDLLGPLAGSTSLETLVAAMRGGLIYANVHTNDGVAPANTGPGDFPGGEIRGQL